MAGANGHCTFFVPFAARIRATTIVLMRESTNKTVKTIIASLCTLAMLPALTACGQGTEDATAEQVRKAEERRKVAEDLGDVRLKDGLGGECDGDSDMLSAGRLDTKDGALYLTFVGKDKIHASSFYAWSVVLTNLDGRQQQVQAVRHLDGGTDRSVFDLTTNHNWDDVGLGDFDLNSSEPDVFQTAVDTTHLKGEAGLKWQVTLSVDGDDVAKCPADGDATLGRG